MNCMHLFVNISEIIKNSPEYITFQILYHCRLNPQVVVMKKSLVLYVPRLPEGHAYAREGPTSNPFDLTENCPHQGAPIMT